MSASEDRVTVHHGDSRDVLKTLADSSIDSCVCDPPYALVSIVKRFGKDGAAPAKGDVYARAAAGFMGKQWDTGETAFDPDFWREVLRVMKPGAHVAAFSGTRTYHRLACAIEDAGFEIRDQIAWLYGSGFPKSHDVAKGIAKRRLEDVEPVRAVCRFVRAAMDAWELKSRDLTKYFGDCNPRLVDHWAARDTDSQPALPTMQQWETLKEVLRLGGEMDAEVARLNGRKGEHGAAWNEAEVIGEYEGEPGGFGDHRFSFRDKAIRALGDDAAAWEGWGTALKPALEPIVLARKPLDGTVAANVLEHGTGALNIDASRIEASGRPARAIDPKATDGVVYTGRVNGGAGFDGGSRAVGKTDLGRWPANVIHDGSEEVIEQFPAEAGAFAPVHRRNADKTRNTYGTFKGDIDEGGSTFQGDSGSAARFFYSAKADAEDRLGSKHPTVKPVDLMAYLCRLVTPPGGVVLDPFAGTGTTGLGAVREGFRAILIERESEYVADINRRLAWARGEGRLTALETARVDPAKAVGADLPLFSGDAA